MLLLILLCQTIQAQQAPSEKLSTFCEIEKANKMAFDSYPNLEAQSNAVLQKFQANIENENNHNVLIDDLVPVVFHLITPCENSFNFTKAQLEEALTEVNEDFTAQNTDEYNAIIDPVFFQDQADIGITFQLAQIDPYGNPTDGITRSNSFYSNHGSNYQIPLKEIIQWNPSRYLNIWIVENVSTSGYAQYPWTAEVYPGLDGIVMSYDYVGENNVNNRPNILTHEIGHWLGLLHTWGDFTTSGSCADPAPTYCDCDDFIDDTPNCLGYNSLSCPSNLPNSCIDPVNDEPDNIYNFMDYACEVMFTNDQKTRMVQTVVNGVADRDMAVTLISDPTVFMSSNPDNNKAKLFVDRYVLTESFDLPGTINEKLIIELRDCPSCSFSSAINSSFTTSGLPANIANGIEITLLNANTAMLHFNMTLTDFAEHDEGADLNNFSIDFSPAAINGISATSEVFNNASIEGLKIDFIDNYPEVMTSTFTPGDQVVQNIVDGDFEGAFIPYLNDYVGFYHYAGSFYMYTASSFQMEAAVTNSNTFHVKRFTGVELLNTATYKTLTPGIFNGANELVVYDANNYTDWLNQTGYVGVRVTMSCGEQFYVWVEIAVSNNELSLNAIGINAFPNGSLDAGQTETCIIDRSITQSFNADHNIHFKATNWISSSSIINSGADIKFDAGDYILLEDGFQVDLGASFQTLSDGCACIPNIPTLSNLSHDDYCTYGYLYCNSHAGNNKEFEFHNLSAGTIDYFITIDHFQYVTLTPNNDYQFRVRTQCGTTGIFGGWSPYFSFSSCLP